MPSIDVIVPCYRYAHYLRECVGSVLAERRLDVRVIILDDASPDNTPEVASQLAVEDARVTYRRHVVNQRHIATYNEGIEWVAADYLLLLSADDYMLPGALYRAVEFLEAHPEIGFVHGRSILTPESGLTQAPAGKGATETWRIQKGCEFIQQVAALGTINPVATPTAIVRTRLQKQVGGYRPELPHSGDMEMWLRLAAYADVAEFDGYFAVWRRHETNMHIGYCGRDYGVADLLQRRAAVDWFMQACGSVLSHPDAVRSRLMAPLAMEALKQASGAFNDGRREVADQQAAFARDIHPEVARTVRWKFLRLKSCLGTRLWRAIYLPAARILKRA